MILIRIILFCLIALLIYGAIRAFTRAGRKAPDKIEHETMVPCEVCQVHVPRHEAIQSGDHWFCGDEHRREWLEKQDPD